MSHQRNPLASVAGFILLLAVVTPRGISAKDPAPASVSFARDVRPVLAEHCFQCHGPDEKKRQGDLRLDIESQAKREIEGHFAIVPGDLSRSELWRRVTAEDDERMPPEDTGRKLTARQRDILRAWIEQGAKWEQHWSLLPPTRPALPAVSQPAWIRTPVDSFVLKRLDSEGLHPSAEADPQRLVRRVTLGLSGLPPTPEEVDAFLADSSPGAYERLIERLLASPRYGERMAWMWLDAARYADTSGYQNDGPRVMWRWRDWVIDAFNHNRPFDQFTVEQIAGDLLPHATVEQRIATGFNRNHRGNAEGGIIPEEYQVEYVVDRVDTTCTVWLGLTMGCARCHDHKYDPLLQKDFYRVFAYFNNIPEYGRAIKEGNSPPYLLAPTDEQNRTLAELDRHLSAARRHFDSLRPKLAEAQLAWESSPDAAQPRQWFVERGLVGKLDFDSPPLAATKPAEKSSEAPATAPPVEPAFVDGDPEYGESPLGRSIALDGKRFFNGGDVANFGYFDKFSASLWVNPRTVKSGTILSRMTDEEQGDGWYVQLRDGHVQVNLVKRWLDDSIRIETRETIDPDKWTQLAFTYDGSRTAKAITVYVNGKAALVDVKLDFINQTFAAKEPLRLGAGNGPDGRFAGAIDEVRIYDRSLSADEVAVLATPEPIHEIVHLPSAKRSPGQQLKLAAFYLAMAAPADVREAEQQWIVAETRQQLFVESLPTVMVMDEMPQPRETYVLLRGEYDKHGDRVTPGTPACFPTLSADGSENRLGFARWLVEPRNPLTARVAVNRIWQLHFGSGLVRTTEDFGAQGESPSHPALLDWLAVEFIESNWDLKHLHRLILESATYRQASRVEASASRDGGDKTAAKSNSQRPPMSDPDNRLLSRGPRFRLSAEVIRDQALSAGGMLTERLGGPSVRPYQPADLWKDLATDNAYVQDHGGNLYRRSLYTYWKRTVAPPSMMTFDAAGREACQVRYSRTNTPLQALALMNEVTYVEAARGLAQRILREAGESPTDRVTLAFRYATSRRPTESELKLLCNAVSYHLDEFRKEPARAEQLLSQGELQRDPQVDPCELAAYTTVASLILNLDEVITRQ